MPIRKSKRPRGRPLAANAARSCSVHVRLTPREHDSFAAAAARADRTLGDWLRVQGLDAIRLGAPGT